MGGKKSAGPMIPAQIKGLRGRGVKECNASGFLRPASGVINDVRQGQVAREFADLTPRFGTWHPQDLVSLGTLDDPSPIPDAEPEDKDNYSIQDLKISDQEVRLSIQEGRPPRRGY
jgi:hypothetical protein